MRQKRRCEVVGGPRMRPEDPADSYKIAAGVLRSMQQSGYDYPVRKLRRSGDTVGVTLPLQVRNFLALECGDWLAFGETPCRGVAAFLKVSAGQYERITPDGRKDFGQLARKVQGKKGGLFVAIPQPICKIISAEFGDSLIFGIAPQRGQISLCVVKAGGNSTGSRRSG